VTGSFPVRLCGSPDDEIAIGVNRRNRTVWQFVALTYPAPADRAWGGPRPPARPAAAGAVVAERWRLAKAALVKSDQRHDE